MPQKRDTAETTPLGRLDEGDLFSVLGYQVAQAAIATVASFKRSAGEKFSLRPVEFTILELVKSNAGVTPSRLASALALKASHITICIDLLESRGLVRRERGEHDRRNMHIRATRKGIEVATTARSLILEGERESLPDLSDGERGILLELLHKVARHRGP